MARLQEFPDSCGSGDSPSNCPGRPLPDDALPCETVTAVRQTAPAALFQSPIKKRSHPVDRCYFQQGEFADLDFRMTGRGGKAVLGVPIDKDGYSIPLNGSGGKLSSGIGMSPSGVAKNTVSPETAVTVRVLNLPTSGIMLSYSMNHLPLLPASRTSNGASLPRRPHGVTRPFRAARW